MKRLFSLFVITLLGLSAVLFFFRLQIGVFLFTRALEQANGENIRIDLAELNSREMVFSRADCTLPGGIRISLQNAVLTWNRASVVKRRLDSIAINTLTLDLPPGNNQARPIKRIPFEQVIRGIDQLRQLLPFRDLQIKHLILHGRSAGLLADRDLGLTLQRHDSRLSGDLVLNKHNLHLTLDSPEPIQWNLGLNEPGQPEPFLTLQVQLQEEEIQADFKTDLARAGLLDSLLNRPLPKMAGALSGTLSLPATNHTGAELVLDLKQFALADLSAASGHLALNVRMSASGKFLLAKSSTLNISTLHKNTFSLADLTINLDGILEKKENSWQYSFSPEAMATVQGITGSNLHIESMQLDPGISGTVSNKKISLNLKPQWRLQISGMQSGPLNIAEAILASEQDMEIECSLDKDYSWALPASGWQLTTSEVQIGDRKFNSAPIHFTVQHLAGTAKGWQGQTRLSSESLDLKTTGNGLSLRDISAELKADTSTIRGTATCSPKTVAGTLAIVFSHDLKEGKGEARVNTREELSLSATTPLSELVNNWPLPGDLTGGQLQLYSSVRWQSKQPIHLSLQAELSAGKGFINEIHFSGISTSQDLWILPEIQSRKTGKISIDEVGTGITVKALTMNTTFAPSPHGRLPQISISNLSASLFGGTVSDKILVYDPQQPDVQSSILLQDIDLARLVTIQQVKGLEVEGRIQGSLPFFLDSSGLRVDGGTVQNTARGGMIRYSPPGKNGMQDSSLTGYALKALEEFHYDILSATAEYSPDGELEISLHLEGTSPKLETNRPVHLNIKTEQNVLSLLNSLRYSKSLTDEIDKEVQKHYQNPTP